jgi:hypothetical protein
MRLVRGQHTSQLRLRLRLLVCLAQPSGGVTGARIRRTFASNVTILTAALIATGGRVQNGSVWTSKLSVCLTP